MEHFLAGAAAFLQPHVLGFTVIGIVAGIIVGLIPGVTITMGVILVLPFTFGMDPLQGIATMVGVAVGGASGGLISATLIGIPGTPSAMATTFDGFPMARRGQPGRALGLGTWASLVGGLLGWIVLVLAAPPLAELGVRFGPWEYFALIVFSLTSIASLAGSSLTKGLIAACLGLLLATVGVDPVLGASRFTFGNPQLDSGFEFLTVLIGLFAFSQLMTDLERRKELAQVERLQSIDLRIPTIQVWRDLWRSKLVVLWSSIVGIWIGIVPAAGGSIANVLAYEQSKRMSKHPEEFGHGATDGVIASEASNNSVSAGDLVPTLALGVPGDAVTAVMLGALLIHGVQPGPLLMVNHATLAYGVIFGYLVATILTLIIQLGGMRLFVRLVHIPYDIMVPGILVLCGLGSYVINNRLFDVWVLLGFGLLGYFMVKHGFELTPFILGFLLEPLAESNIKRALQTNPDLTVFVTRPMSGFLLLLAALTVAYYFYRGFRAHRAAAQPAEQEDGRVTLERSA